MKVEVKDIDRGYRKVVDALLDAEELEAVVGVLSATITYPEKKGGTKVARVGALLEHRYGILGIAFDHWRRTNANKFRLMQLAILKGANPREAYKKLADEFRDYVKDQIMRNKLYETGLFHRSIKSRVGKPRKRRRRR